MPATTITPYGRYGQKDVCFGRMLKKAAPEEDRYLAYLCVSFVRLNKDNSMN